MALAKFALSVILQSFCTMASSHRAPGMAFFRPRTAMPAMVSNSHISYVHASNIATPVIVDHHEYQVFTNDMVAMPPWQHRQRVCNNVASYASGADKWVVVGEWTAAMTDCARALNG